MYRACPEADQDGCLNQELLRETSKKRGQPTSDLAREHRGRALGMQKPCGSAPLRSESLLTYFKGTQWSSISLWPVLLHTAQPHWYPSAGGGLRHSSALKCERRTEQSPPW